MLAIFSFLLSLFTVVILFLTTVEAAYFYKQCLDIPVCISCRLFCSVEKSE